MSLMIILCLFIYLLSDTTNLWQGGGRGDMKYIKTDGAKSCRGYTKTDIIDHKTEHLREQHQRDGTFFDALKRIWLK